METATPTSEPGAVGSSGESTSGNARTPPALAPGEDSKIISQIYWAKCAAAEKALPSALPRVWEYCQKHIAAGRTWSPIYALKLLELWDILQTEKPSSVIELGSGCTTAVFAEYAESVSPAGGCRVVSVDESQEWQDSVRVDVASDKIDYQVSPVRWMGKSAVGYANTSCDGFGLIYVDGPSNKMVGQKDTAICLDALPVMTICDKQPSVVAFDIRRETVRFYIPETKHYHWSLSAWQETNTPWYLSGARHHTVARRKACS